MAPRNSISKRKCPVCDLEKEFPNRNETCSQSCGRRWKITKEAAGKTEPSVAEDALDAAVKNILKKSGGRLSLKQLSEKLDRSEATVGARVELLRARGLNIDVDVDHVTMSGDVKPGAEEPLIIHDMRDYGPSSFRSFGALGDNHLGSKHERLDVLNALYDVYEREGITEVFNTGNWIEGEFRLNKHDIKVYGLDNQINYFIEKYPRRDGITTYFVAGDDHEGWYQQRENVEIGRYAMLRAREEKRDDLIYLGYVEANIELKRPNGSAWMKVMHPGGGCAYALSYASQKLVESFQGGEKPSVLLYGHYHKYDVNYAREVHCVGTGCTVDQSIFMRKAKIAAHVGGTIIRLNQADTGHINRFQVEWLPFYDRDFYSKKRIF